MRAFLAAVVLVPLIVACAPRISAVTSTVLPAASAPATAVFTARSEVPAFASEGIASWYGPGFAGRLTANGEVFDPGQLTAAHRTLPFNTHLRVINLNNGKSVVVRINDRGPFKGGRIIDLSRAAAQQVGMIGSGTAPVRIEPLNGVGGVLAAAAGEQLDPYDIVARGRQAGELLLLSSSTGGPVLVRVVGNAVPSGVGADLLLSHALIAELGSSVSIRALD